MSFFLVDGVEVHAVSGSSLGLPWQFYDDVVVDVCLGGSMSSSAAGGGRMPLDDRGRGGGRPGSRGGGSTMEVVVERYEFK